MCVQIEKVQAILHTHHVERMIHPRQKTLYPTLPEINIFAEL